MAQDVQSIAQRIITEHNARTLTTHALLQRNIPDDVRAWLEQHAVDPEFAPANNPPSFVTDEGCWEKAKRAADYAGASDYYAFATWWYQEYC